jgi:hypothetical protein
MTFSEDEEDDLACGKAYGGSRIAVVSAARYDPSLDKKQKISREHVWPASHGEEYIRTCCEAADDELERVEMSFSQLSVEDLQAPMYAALAARNTLPLLDRTPSPAARYLDFGLEELFGLLLRGWDIALALPIVYITPVRCKEQHLSSKTRNSLCISDPLISLRS